MIGKIFQKYSNPLFSDVCDGDGKGDGVEGRRDGEVVDDLIHPVSDVEVKRETEDISTDNNDNSDNKNNNDTENVNINDRNNDDNNDNDDDLMQLKILHAAAIQKGACMIGVDVSMKMVEITRNTKCYTFVARADLCDALKIFERSKNSEYCHRSERKNNTPNNEITTNTTINSQELGPINSASLDMIIVADTFIYVGALGSVFAQIRLSLKENGLFLFSIEDLDSSPMKVNVSTEERTVCTKACTDSTVIDNNNTIKSLNNTILDEKNSNNDMNSKSIKISDCEIEGAVPGWGGQLLKSARFAHSDSYIQILAENHGFQILKMKFVVLRTEETISLYGRLYVLQSV